MKIRNFMSVQKSILKFSYFPYDYKKYLITVKNYLSLTKLKGLIFIFVDFPLRVFKRLGLAISIHHQYHQIHSHRLKAHHEAPRRLPKIYVYTETEYSDFNDFQINMRGWIIIDHVIKALITLKFSW